MVKDLKNAIVFNVLVKKAAGEYIAHCLELDIVTTADNLEQAKKDIGDLIMAQIDYAFTNDNLANLYRPAPAEVWREFFKCQAKSSQQREFRASYGPDGMVPAWIIANTCLSENNYLVP